MTIRFDKPCVAPSGGNETTSTFDPNNKNTAYISLIDGNLTYIVNGNDDPALIFAQFVLQKTKKYYWEVSSIVVFPDPNNTEFGVANVTTDVTVRPKLPGSLISGGIGYSAGGNVRRNGSVVAVAATWTTDDVIMFAVDVDAGLIWVGKNGTWHNSGNPAGGTNPTTTLVINEGVCPCIGDVRAASTVSRRATINFGAVSFAYTAPTGFDRVAVPA